MSTKKQKPSASQRAQKNSRKKRDRAAAKRKAEREDNEVRRGLRIPPIHKPIDEMTFDEFEAMFKEEEKRRLKMLRLLSEAIS